MLKLIFIAYSALAIFVTMNVITGFFVDAALCIAGREKRMIAVNALSVMWEGFDKDCSGGVSADEFADNMRDPCMAHHLRDIDLYPSDAAQLFAVLDDDCSGEVGIDELLH